ncbi:hypothetical protein [Nesterenkonia sp. K-15-9-6]|uniref:hypothetical protein n=1 Tax=Nesterenkonia sp. K-15-9-6 TaxID=3093918 RepID=UPI00404444DF
MPQSSMELIAARLAALERQQRALAAQPRLADASLDDTSLPIRDRSGSITGTIGKQPDGSFGTIVRNSPPQGTPTAAHLSAGEMGAVESTWDGNVTEGQVYEVHGHIEVHTALADGDVAPTPEDAHLASTIRDREGGTTTIVCSRPGTWWVWLRMVGADRVTKGEFSEPSQIEITELVDTGAIEERLDEAEQRIADARSDFEQGQAQLEDNLEHLNEVRLPGLESDLNSAIAAVQSDLDAFQQEWDENWDPAAFDELRDRADNLEQNIQDGLTNADAQIRSLAITDPHNLNRDPSFESLYQAGDPAPDRPLWYSATPDAWHHATTSWGDPHKQFVRFDPERLDASGNYQIWLGGHLFANRWMRCTPGEELRIRWQVLRYAGWSADDGYYFRMRFQDDAQSGVAWSDPVHWGAVGNQEWAETVVTVPDGAAIMSFQWYRLDAVAASRGFGNVHVTRMANGELIVDGSVLARHIDTYSLSAHVGFIDAMETNLLQARLLQADEALIDGVLLKDKTISAQHLRIGHTGNLLGNADFSGEDGPAGWSTGLGNRTVVEGGGKGGGPALRIAAGTSQRGSYLGAADPAWLTPVTGGTTYRVRAWVRSGTPISAGNARIYVRQYGTRTTSQLVTNLVVSNAETIPADTWGLLDAQITLREDANFLAFGMFVQGAHSAAVDWSVPQLVEAVDATLVVDGSLKARHADVEEFFSNQAVINKIWSDVVRARMLEADEAFIGGAVIMDDAIDVSKINVTESLAAALGEFLHLVTGSIEMNEFIANSGLVGRLEALGITLSDEGAGRRFEVSGQGWRLEDTTTGNTLSQMGLHGDDLLSMHDSETGEPTVSMTGAGGVSAVQLHSGEDMTIAGKSLVGRAMDTAPWHAAQSVLETVGQGAPRVFIRQVAGLSHSNSRAIAHLEAKIIPGRSYRISVPDFQMSDRQHYFMTAYYTTSSDPSVRPSTPTNSSAQLGTTTGRVPPSGLGWPSTTLSFEKVYGPRTAQWIRILFVVGNYEGTGITFGSTNTIAHNPRFLIQDLGPRVGDGGVLTWRDPSSALATAEPSDLVSQPYPILRTATYTWDPNTGDATRQGIDVEPRFGYWPDGTFYLTLVQFGAWDQGGQFNSVDVQSTVARWATSAGQVLQSGLTTITGTPPTSFHAPTENHRLPDLTRVGAGSTRRLPTEKEEEADQAAQVRASVLIGWSGWTGAHLNNAAAGVLHRNQTYAMLSTSTSTQD